MQPYVLVQQQGSEQADEWMRLGLAAQTQGDLPLAQRHYMNALRLDPRHALATQNLAIVFAQSNLLNEGLLAIERAAMFDDNKHALIQMNWALMLLDADRVDDAVAAARRAYAITACTETRVALAMVLGAAGRPAEAAPLYDEVLVDHPNHPAAGPNSCFLQTLLAVGPAELRAQRNKWYAANRYTGPVAPHKNARTHDRPLRVGYVSGDFKRHSAAMIFGRVVFHHTAAVQPFLYSTLTLDPNSDPVTQKAMNLPGGQWRDITPLNDEQADERIRQDEIDILVDLAGHTNGGRLGVFTRKPAPIQVTAWGFAHGTGLPEIDYFFADPIAVPLEEREYYTEKIWDLPCVVTYEPPVEYDVKGTSSSPYFTRGYVTFGSYARFEKLSDECLKTFAEVLRAVPDSKLEFKDHGFRKPSSIRRVLAAMPDIDPSRLLFSISTSHPDHMLAYQQADLILDPFPHTGGVVGLEQIYMGVPIITLYGTQAAGRTTSSVLTALGRTQWIAKSPEQYVELATTLTQDLRALAKERLVLREQLLASPIYVGYVDAVEAAYREMWRLYAP